MAKVVIGVDPHKRINAVVVLSSKGKVLGRTQLANSADGFRQLRAFSRQWRPRTWAVEGCNGVGKHLAQRLVAEGERVVDVSTRRAALVRVFAGGNGLSAVKRKCRSAYTSTCRSRGATLTPGAHLPS